MPKDQAAGVFITTPAPTYDANDNVVTAVAPNGAIGSAVFDNLDRIIEALDPVDNTGEPQRKTTFTYDTVGNLLTTTEPKGNLTPNDPADFVTTNVYDEIYQLTRVVNVMLGSLCAAATGIIQVVERCATLVRGRRRLWRKDLPSPSDLRRWMVGAPGRTRTCNLLFRR